MPVPARHQQIIEAVRAHCQHDARVSAALMYGSVPKGEADAFSDVEFYVFFRGGAAAELDIEDWLRSVEPPLACFENEYGTRVAIFDDLLRGEFHFVPDTEIERVSAWGSIERGGTPEAMLLWDGEGRLDASLRAIQRQLPTDATVQQTYDRFLNTFLLGCNVLQRGERARALDTLATVQRFLLQLARIREDSVDHWLTPSRAWELEASQDAQRRLADCTARLDDRKLRRAYGQCWTWSLELIDALAETRAVDRRARVVERTQRRVVDWLNPEAPGS